MFKKKFVGHHGFLTFVQGVYRIVDGEYYVLVTRTGRDNDEFVVGECYSLEEIAGITEGDVFAYEESAAKCLVT